MAVFITASIAAIVDLAHADTMPMLLGIGVIVASAWEWFTLRKLSEDSARAADRLIGWIGLALLAMSMAN